MKKLSQRRRERGVIMKKFSQRRGAAEIAELLFEIFVLNSGNHQNIYWIKCIFVTKRIPPRSLRLRVSAKASSIILPIILPVILSVSAEAPSIMLPVSVGVF